MYAVVFNSLIVYTGGNTEALYEVFQRALSLAEITYGRVELWDWDTKVLIEVIDEA